MQSFLTIDHPKWEEFFAKIVASCDFTERKPGNYSWNCDGTHKKTIAILEKHYPWANVHKTLSYFRRNGGNCDCEVCFNVPAPKAWTDHESQSSNR